MSLATGLPEGYEIRSMTWAEFSPLYNQHAKGIFADSQIFRYHQFLSEDEKTKFAELGQNYKGAYELNLALFYKNKFAGWCSGDQHSAEAFYMRNSAILPEHRRKGLYTALLTETLRVLTEKGFQKIYSRHNATNNPVIIPKLKAGFVISTLEVSDMFGTLVHLTYLTNPLRRKMMIYRTGDMMPDAEIKSALGL